MNLLKANLHNTSGPEKNKKHTHYSRYLHNISGKKKTPLYITLLITAALHLMMRHCFENMVLTTCSINLLVIDCTIVLHKVKALAQLIKLALVHAVSMSSTLHTPC